MVYTRIKFNPQLGDQYGRRVWRHLKRLWSLELSLKYKLTRKTMTEWMKEANSDLGECFNGRKKNSTQSILEGVFSAPRNVCHTLGSFSHNIHQRRMGKIFKAPSPDWPTNCFVLVFTQIFVLLWYIDAVLNCQANKPERRSSASLRLTRNGYRHEHGSSDFHHKQTLRDSSDTTIHWKLSLN